MYDARKIRFQILRIYNYNSLETVFLVYFNIKFLKVFIHVDQIN